MDKLFSELRRRHVFKVAGAYGVVAWLLIQVATTTFPVFGAPAWVLRVVIALAVLGFPVAVVLAWAFELTPDGVRRARTLTSGEEQLSPPRQKRSFDSRTAGWVGVGMLAGLVGVGAYSWTYVPETATGGASGGSLAVLPFANGSADPSDAYLSEGIAEEILNALSQVPQLRVAARTSSFSFQGQSVALDSIARALKVDHVLEGSVHAAGDRVRIMARLVDASTGAPVWSRSYDRDLEDVLAVQEEIAVAIANALQVKLAGADASRLTRSRAVDPEAYDLYLQGRQLASKRTKEELWQAAQRFEAAVQRDPAFAAAYSGLADAYALLEDLRALPRQEAFPESVAAAQRALELDDLQAEAHASLGHIFYHQGNLSGAEQEYQRALKLNPNYATAHLWYANLLLDTQGPQPALVQIEKAYTLDPLAPKIRENRGWFLYFAGQYDRAIAWHEELIGLDPENLALRYWLAWMQTAAGKHGEAIATMEGVVDAVPAGEPNAWAKTRLAAAYAMAGQRENALQLLRELEQNPRGVPNESVMAVAYGHLGDLDAAFRWLTLAAERNHWMAGMIARVDPAFAPLHQDRRFRQVIRRIG